MNQWIAWCWGTFLSPPLTDVGVTLWRGRTYGDIFTRGHRSYGLLVGRVFVGVTLSFKL